MYENQYREYLKNCIEDEDFDMTTVENYTEWIETEKDINAEKCQQCESLNTIEEDNILICSDCGHELVEKNKKKERK